MKALNAILKFIKLIILIGFLTLIIFFCVANNTEILLSLFPLPFEIETRLFIVAAFFLIVGLIIGRSFSLAGFIKGIPTTVAQKSESHKLKKSVEVLTKEKEKLQKEIDKCNNDIESLSEETGKRKRNKDYF